MKKKMATQTKISSKWSIGYECYRKERQAQLMYSDGVTEERGFQSDLWDK